jgi:hypothetical protein
MMSRPGQEMRMPRIASTPPSSALALCVCVCVCVIVVSGQHALLH